MSRQARIIVFGEDSPATRRLVDDLAGESFEVVAAQSPAELRNKDAPPDLVLIDASARPDFLSDVRACREAYPPQTTGVLVLGETDPNASAAAIEAGATDSVADALAGPLLTAHVRRLLRASESMRHLLEEERRRAKQESLALAAAGVAVPLGNMLDELESIMARQPVGERLDELLELTSKAVDAVDRLRQMASAASENPEPSEAKRRS